MPDTTTTTLLTEPKTTELVQNSMDGNHFTVFIAIILLMGILGGLANFLNSKKEEKSFWRSVVMGLVAAFSIPLFLKIVDSSLISGTSINYHSYLVFAGFCILAAFYSGRFLEGLSGRVLQSLQEKVEENSTKLETTTEKTNLLVETELSGSNKEDPTNEKDNSTAESRGIDYSQLSPAGKLEAAFTASRNNLQNMGSLEKKTGLSQEEIQKELEEMIKAGKVKQIMHNKEKVFGMVK